MNIPETNPYLEFVKTHFPGEYMANWHHIVASWYIHQWVIGEIPYLIMEFPPQYGKSVLGAVMAMPYIFKQYPTSKASYITYGEGLSKRMSNESKTIMRSTSYKEAFLELSVPLSFRGWQYWETTLKGIATYTSRGGGLAGTPQDFVIVDDLFKDHLEATSPTIRESAWKWFTTVALERLSPQGRALLFFTRWHSDDVIGRALKLLEKSQYARPWVRISFPGLMTAEKFKNKHFADPREIGEALWPWKDTVEKLEMKRLELGEAEFNSIIQQTPLNEEGTKIKPKWFKKVSLADLPKKLKWHRFYRLGELARQTVDTNNATGLMAKLPDGKFAISELDYFQEDWPSTLQRIKNVGKSEKRIKIGITKIGGKKKDLFDQVMDCRREMRRLKDFPAVSPLNWAAEAKSGKLLLVEDGNTADFLEACRNFTGSGKDKREAEIHALAGCYGMLSSRRSAVKAYAEKYLPTAS